MFRSPFMKTGMFFSPDGGGAGAGGAGDAGNAGDGGQGDGGAGDAGKTGNQNAETKSYTQAQLDSMFSERATRAEKAAVENLIKALGVKDEAELKAILEENKKRKEGEMSDLQKAQAATKTAEDAAALAKTEAEKTLAAATDKLKKADVKAYAVTAGFIPEAIEDVWASVDKEKITEKDGAFIGVKEAVEAVKTAKPWLLAANRPAARGTPQPNQNKTEGDGNRVVPKGPRSF